MASRATRHGSDASERLQQTAKQEENAEEKAASQQESPTGVQTTELEDSHLSGGSKSHQRRVLALNVDGKAGQSQQHPETTAGQHATGSFTGDADANDGATSED